MSDINTPNSPFIMGDQSGVHRVILDNNEIIDELINTLKGEILDVVKNEIRKVGNSIVPDEALSWIVGNLLPFTSKIFALSFLKKEIISQMKYEFGEKIAGDLMFCEELGIERKHRDTIYNLMIQTFTATIHKAEGGETLKKLLSQHTISEQILHEERKKKLGGVIPDIFPKGNGG